MLTLSATVLASIAPCSPTEERAHDPCSRAKLSGSQRHAFDSQLLRELGRAVAGEDVDEEVAHFGGLVLSRRSGAYQGVGAAASTVAVTLHLSVPPRVSATGVQPICLMPPPAGADKSLPAELTLRAVDVREVDPPEDARERVHWRLLTTHAVATAAEAMQIVRWYRLRWTIEQVFRAMKTDGVDVETSQITTPGSLLKLVTVALIAAVRVMQLVMGRDGSTGQMLTDVIAIRRKFRHCRRSTPRWKGGPRS
jgi:hypothetical protein